MSARPLQNALPNDLPKSKRPLILTIICIAYMFLFSWQLVELLTPSSFLAAIDKLPPWFVGSQLIVFYPLGIVSMIGVWRMRKWGVYLFFSSVLLSMVVMYLGLHLLPHARALVYVLVFLVVTLRYFRQMR